MVSPSETLLIKSIELLTSSALIQVKQELERAVMVFALYTHHPPTLTFFFAVSQLPVVRSEHARTLFDRTRISGI